MEKNQSSEERHFGIMKRRQSCRPKLDESALLSEEQVKEFAKHANLFEVLGYNNSEATELVSEEAERAKCLIEESEVENEEKEDAEGDIEQVINKILTERENYYSGDESDYLDYNEER